MNKDRNNQGDNRKNQTTTKLGNITKKKHKKKTFQLEIPEIKPNLFIRSKKQKEI